MPSNHQHQCTSEEPNTEQTRRHPTPGSPLRVPHAWPIKRERAAEHDGEMSWCVSKLKVKLKFFRFHFLHSYRQSTRLRAPFQSLTKVALKKFVSAADTKNGAFALDSSSKRDKGFCHCLCYIHTHNMPQHIRRYNVKEGWTYCFWQNIYKRGLSSAGMLGRHHLRCMTKNKNHDSLAWENPA